MRVTYDPAKRDKTLADRGLALEGRMVVIGYTPRGAVRHIFGMRKANTREQARLAPYLEI